MFLVFGWKWARAHGGLNDLLGVFPTEPSALEFVERLMHTDPDWECHIANDALEILYENGSGIVLFDVVEKKRQN